MGQEQTKTTLSEPSTFSEPRMSNGHLPLAFQNRFLLYENNYLRNVNNLLNEIDDHHHHVHYVSKHVLFSEPASVPGEAEVVRVPPAETLVINPQSKAKIYIHGPIPK